LRKLAFFGAYFSTRKHDYELPSPPKYVAFSGSGTTLTAPSSGKSHLLVQQDIKPQPPKVNLFERYN